MSSTLTGYGPSKRLLFDGDESKCELWEVKFLGHMRRHKLLDILTGTEAPDDAKNAATPTPSWFNCWTAVAYL